MHSHVAGPVSEPKIATVGNLDDKWAMSEAHIEDYNARPSPPLPSMPQPPPAPVGTLTTAAVRLGTKLQPRDSSQLAGKKVHTLENSTWR